MKQNKIKVFFLCATIHRAVPLLCKLLIAHHFQGMLRFLTGKFIFSVLANGQTTSTVKTRSFMQSRVHMVCMTVHGPAWLFCIESQHLCAPPLCLHRPPCTEIFLWQICSRILLLNNHNCNLIVSGVLQQQFSATHLSQVNILFRKNLYHR